MPIPCRELWKACAVPPKEALIVAGTCIAATALLTSSMASDKATPGRTSKENVTDGSCPRWVTASGPTL